MYKKIYTIVLATLVLGSLHIHIFAQDISRNTEKVALNNYIDNSLNEEIYLKYPNAINIEFISNNGDVHYFRVFEKKGSMNYKLVECTVDSIDNTIKISELNWIWAKVYASEIRDIQFKMLKTGDIAAKVYLRNGQIMDEEIMFTDPVNNYHFIESNEMATNI